MNTSSSKPRNPIRVLITTQFDSPKPPALQVTPSRIRQAIQHLIEGERGLRAKGKGQREKPEAEDWQRHEEPALPPTTHHSPMPQSAIEVSVCLCDDATIRRYNAAYRQVDEATDVLSFPQHPEGGQRQQGFETPNLVELTTKNSEQSAIRNPQSESPPLTTHHPPILLGDVLVSVETARRQAEKNHLPVEAEVLMLCLHGTLHLLGYEHETEAERLQMNRIAVRTLQKFGYPLQEDWYSTHYER